MKIHGYHTKCIAEIGNVIECLDITLIRLELTKEIVGIGNKGRIN